MPLEKMRTFDGNLNAYHVLNTFNDMYVKQMQRRINEASTQEELKEIMEERDAHRQEQEELYKELGEEMIDIMSKKWWQFWK